MSDLHQLTATKAGRQIMRKKNVYPIMREFHKWEKEPHVISACEKLVQVHTYPFKYNNSNRFIVKVMLLYTSGVIKSYSTF